MNVAETLQDAVRVLEPKSPLTLEQMPQYYVDREGNPTRRLSVLLSNEAGHTKIIFTGHRGSGKSTELNRLSSLLGGRFFVVNYTVEGNLDLNDLDHAQVLFSFAAALWRTARKRGLRLEETEVKTIRDLVLTLTETEEREVRRDPGTEAGLDRQIARMSSKLKSEPATRRSFTRRVEPQISEFLDGIQKEIAQIEKRAQKEVVVIVDGLDKPSVDIAKRLFISHGESLFSIACKCVFTAPLSLLYANEFAQIKHNVSSAYVLPNIPVYQEDGQPDHAGRGTLREVLCKRVEPALFSQNALSKLIENSGGVVREVVMLTQSACVSAIAEDRSQVILEDVQDVVEEAKNNYRRILRESHYRELTELVETGQFRNSEIAQDLLHNLSLLEYITPSGRTWFALHPIVKSLLAESQILES